MFAEVSRDMIVERQAIPLTDQRVPAPAGNVFYEHTSTGASSLLDLDNYGVAERHPSADLSGYA